MLLIDTAHQSSGGRQCIIDEDEDGLLWRQLDALPDHIDELADRQVCRDQILLLVDSSDIGLLDLLADHLVQMDTSARVRQLKNRRYRVAADERIICFRQGSVELRQNNLPECDPHTSGECARLRPCASQRDARP
jgi:hypothetical protein